jgi:RNA polymerase sigma-70 factor, ECF subfamily
MSSTLVDTTAEHAASQQKSLPRRTATAAQMEALIEMHGAALQRFTLSLTNGNRVRAEELAQETLIRAWRHPEALESSAEYFSFRPWLFKVARRLAIDAQRARDARPQETDDSTLEQMPQLSTDVFERITDIALVRQALKALTPEQRDVLVCTYFRGLSGPETSEVLGIPVGTVKSRAHYALKALQAELRSRGFGR